jgi:hypothetical protein
MDVTPPPAPAAAPRKPPMPSEWLGGLGFLAALVAGALFYATARGRERPEFVTCASEIVTLNSEFLLVCVPAMFCSRLQAESAHRSHMRDGRSVLFSVHTPQLKIKVRKNESVTPKLRARWRLPGR